jgi:PEP-CTERM motif-containing protein
MKRTVMVLAVSALVGLAFPNTARAADILCENVALNHMLISDSFVSACLDAGTGNINGNPAQDPFLQGVGSAFTGIDGGSFTQNGGSGTFSLSSSLWSSFNPIAIGFKFGTGNQPDEWFVYQLQTNVSSGSWTFVNVFGTGGGLSHVQLYGIEGETPPPPSVPEPASMLLVGLGFTATMVGARRRN